MKKTSNNLIINDYEIMIVGGGPAGISTWLHLQKVAPDLASNCILIEKEKYPREKICGGAVGGWSENIFRKFGIDINVNSFWIDNVECIFENDVYKLHEKKYFKMVRRADFDYVLAKFAQKKGLNIRQKEIFLDFKRKKNDLVVKTNSNKFLLKALVGADGALSKVRQKMKFNHKSNLAPTIEILSPVNPKYDKEFEEKKVTFDFSPIKYGIQGYIWHFPSLYNNREFINHGIVDFRIYNKSRKINIKKVLINNLIKRGIKKENLIFSSFPIRWLSKDDLISQPNILLVGDAAGIEPATGGGIHLALSYGNIAANSIVNGFKNDDFTFNDYYHNFKNDLTGRYIDKLSSLAYKMYDQTINPIDAMKKIFIKR